MSDQPAVKSPKSPRSPEKETPEVTSPTTATPAVAPAVAPTSTSAAVTTTSAPQPDLVPADDDYDDDEDGDGVHDDADSALGHDAASSTASVTSSILEYRYIQGRTYHSDRHPTEYFIPNDDQQLESVDITHHYLTVLLDGRLFLAPISKDIQRVLDIGTGSGIWAIDFADTYPNAEVIGSDLSPSQPQWVPPNVRFEIDDASLTWTWRDNAFDFVHIRYLFGAIKDWTALFKEAYRCCAPGGWVESCEADIEFQSDDGTHELEPALATWLKLYEEGEKALGNPFFIQKKGLQEKGLEEAGFVDIRSVDYKIPVGGWPKDPKLAEVGNFVKMTMENDVEGYTLLLWTQILGWPQDDYQLFLMGMRKALRNRKVHSYMTVRYVYARKPE